MITDLETLLNEDQFRELVKAINENREYNYEEKGLKINANSNDNSLQLSIAYDEDKKENSLVQKELDNFQNYLKDMDDDLFTEVCDALDNEEIQKIQNCLNSNKLETVRAAIVKFKSVARKIITDKIVYLNNLLYA